MPQLSAWAPGKLMRFFVWSKPKVGKTYGAATFPRPNFLSFDPNGISTLRGRDFLTNHRDLVKDIRYEVFTEKSRNAKGVITTHTAFDEGCAYFDACMKPTGGKWKGENVGPDQFDTWVLDTCTTLSEVAMNKAAFLLGTSQFKNLSQTHKQALETGLLVPKIQDYGAERSLVEQFVQMLLDTDKHVIILAHDREELNDAGAVVARTPLLTGKSVAVVGAKFDEIWMLKAEKSGPNMVRKLVTESDGVNMVGSRYGIRNGTAWNYTAIMNELNEIAKIQS